MLEAWAIGEWSRKEYTSKVKFAVITTQSILYLHQQMAGNLESNKSFKQKSNTVAPKECREAKARNFWSIHTGELVRLQEVFCLLHLLLLGRSLNTTQ